MGLSYSEVSAIAAFSILNKKSNYKLFLVDSLVREIQSTCVLFMALSCAESASEMTLMFAFLIYIGNNNNK